MKSAATPVKNDLDAVRDMVRACIQCGTCSASCPNEFAMDITPRRLWRLVLMDRAEKIFSSRTFMLCSVCYCCTLRCPRGLPLTEAMAALKRTAARAVPQRYKKSVFFYKDFMESVRRHGRVREAELMTLYFAHMKNPLLPFRFAPLGMKLAAKKKIELQLPFAGRGKLDALFANIKAMEEGTK